MKKPWAIVSIEEIISSTNIEKPLNVYDIYDEEYDEITSKDISNKEQWEKLSESLCEEDSSYENIMCILMDF